MKPSVYLLVIITAFGCTTAPRQDSTTSIDQERQLRDEQLRAEVVRDSLQAVRDSVVAEQQKVAFGTLRFGMGKGEVNSLMSEMDTDYGRVQIGTEQYYIVPSYTEDDRLYRLDIASSPKSATYWETEVLNSANNLSAVISQKYGPATHSFGKPKFFDFDAGHMQVMERWEVGTKSIMVGIVETRSGAQYSAEAFIFDNVLTAEVNAAEDAKAASDQAKSAQNF